MWQLKDVMKYCPIETGFSNWTHVCRLTCCSINTPTHFTWRCTRLHSFRALFTETKKPQKYTKHCLFEATICLCGVNNKIQKRVSDYKFIYANLRIRQNNLVVCNEFNFKLLKFFTSNIWFNCILHVMRNFHEKSKCGINFLLRKIPMVRAGPLVY